MKALVVGCGRVGSEIARDLSFSREVSSVIAADASAENLDKLRPFQKIKTVRASLRQKRLLKALMDEVDLVCGALPGRIGFQLLEQAVDSGKDIVDISYTAKNPLLLHRKALANRCAVVPQCGIAPGFTNMCVGDAARRMERMLRVRIFVGGLPQEPEAPLNYRVVFSLDDVINEYTRPVRIIENGTRKIVDPLTGEGTLTFPRVGKLEYFLTDGLGTLPSSFRGVREMYEFTLRYPGHVRIINALRQLGFFNSKSVRVNGDEVEPRGVSMEILRHALAVGSPQDLLALRVEVEGKNKGRTATLRYQLLDLFDRRRQISAMARTTAYSCTSVAVLLGKGMIEGKGVVPPERIGENPELFGLIVSYLEERGVKLKTLSKNTRS